jgi:hypothetical protein
MEGSSHFEVLCHLDSKLPPNFRLGKDGVLAGDDLEFFFVDAGLGIFHAPLFRGYVEDVYFELIETLLAPG